MTAIFCPKCRNIKGERFADRYVMRNGGDERISPLPVHVHCRCGCRFEVDTTTIRETRYTTVEINTEADAPTLAGIDL